MKPCSCCGRMLELDEYPMDRGKTLRDVSVLQSVLCQAPLRPRTRTTQNRSKGRGRLMATFTRALVLRRTSEQQFQDWVLNTAALNGYHGLHIRVSRDTLEGLHGLRRPFPRQADHDDAYGFPDLALVKGDRLLMPELKAVTGRVSPGQRLWHEWLSQVREVHSPIWRPTDEREIERVLRGEP